MDELLCLGRIRICKVEPKEDRAKFFKNGDVATFLPGKWPVATSFTVTL